MTIEEKIEEVLQKAASADEVLFMLDGFDEFGSKEKFAQDIFKLQERPHVKIIITSRIYYLSKQDIEFCFSFKNKRENNQE
jgi:predicted NACHT family NTPase